MGFPYRPPLYLINPRVEPVPDFGPDNVRSELGQALGFGEHTIIETRAKRTDIPNHDMILFAIRSKPVGIRWTEDGKNRTGECRCDVCGTTVVAHHQIAGSEVGDKLRNRKS